MTAKEAEALRYNFFGFLARPKQRIPYGNWMYWVICSGRGFGKTRVGAEWVREMVKHYPYVNIAGASSDDIRSVMVEGESGILAVCPSEEKPEYKKQLAEIHWGNGAKTLCLSAQDPDKFRGKQHQKFWADEFCSWRNSGECFSQIDFGLRLGDSPQMLITTTPKPSRAFKEIINHKDCIITVGSTFENKNNLAESYINSLLKKYEGTRLGRQEIYAQILDDVQGALWNYDNIDTYRIKSDFDYRQLNQIVVAIDPAISNEEHCDETGIIVVGCNENKEIFVLEDRSGRYTPEQWAIEVHKLYNKYEANFIVAEKNQGGQMVESTLRTKINNANIHLVHASRGKFTRAEPVSAIYERGKAHHVGTFQRLEDQMTQFTSDFDRKSQGYSPDRVDALVWGITFLSPFLSRVEEKDYRNVKVQPILHPLSGNQRDIRLSSY